MTVKTILKIVCMYCGAAMGQKDGKGVEGTSHSICKLCWQEHYPEYDYIEGENETIVLT